MTRKKKKKINEQLEKLKEKFVCYYDIENEQERHELIDSVFNKAFNLLYPHRYEFEDLVKDMSQFKVVTRILSGATSNGFVSVVFDSYITKILCGFFSDEKGYDIIILDEEGNGIRISSKTAKTLLKNGTFINSNFMKSKKTQDGKKIEEKESLEAHLRRTECDVYFLIQTGEHPCFGIGSRRLKEKYLKIKDNTTDIEIPDLEDTLYFKWILRPEEITDYDLKTYEIKNPLIKAESMLLNSMSEYFESKDKNQIEILNNYVKELSSYVEKLKENNETKESV